MSVVVSLLIRLTCFYQIKIINQRIQYDWQTKIQKSSTSRRPPVKCGKLNFCNFKSLKYNDRIQLCNHSMSFNIKQICGIRSPLSFKMCFVIKINRFWLYVSISDISKFMLTWVTIYICTYEYSGCLVNVTESNNVIIAKDLTYCIYSVFSWVYFSLDKRNLFRGTQTLHWISIW